MKIGITGHQAIPEPALEFVRSGITEVIRSADRPVIGISSLAAGADQLFASIVLELGGELWAILPSQAYESTFKKPEELDQFRLLTIQASSVETLNYPEPSESAFLEAGHQVADRCDVLIAVWDGKPAVGTGGTADIVDYARRHARDVSVIWPMGVER